MASDRLTRTGVGGKWGLAVLVAASALAMGSLHTPWLIVMAVLAAVSAVLLWLHPAPRITRASRIVSIVAVGLVGVCVLQVIPLPAGLVRAIAPTNADVWARALTPLREAGPAWH